MTRARLAFLLVLTVLALSIAARGLTGNEPLWAAAALLLLGPSLVLAWRDFWRDSSRTG